MRPLVLSLMFVSLALISGCDLLKGTKLAPVAVIEALPQQGAAPLEVRFSGARSHDIYGQVTAYAWAFGDGTTSEQKIVTHTYPRVGTYVATLTVTNSLGIKNSDRVTIFVEEPPPPPPPPEPPPPSERSDVRENALVKVTRTVPGAVGPEPVSVEVTVEAKVALELVAVVEGLEGLTLATGELTKFQTGLQPGERLSFSYTLRDDDGGGGAISGTVRAKPPNEDSQTLTLTSTLAAR